MSHPATDPVPIFVPHSAARVRAMEETVRLHAAHALAAARRDACPRAPEWRVAGGVERLVVSGPRDPRDRRDRVRVLGPRGPETEDLARRLSEEAALARADLAELEEALSLQAAANRAAGIGVVPLQAAAVLRALPPGTLAGGAAALAGFLSIARGRIDPRAGPDPLAPLRDRLELDGRDAPSLCKALRALGEGGFVPRSPGLATGRDGYVVECRPAATGPAGPVAVAVAVDGFPVAIPCPDPVAYVAAQLARADQGGAEGTLALAQARAAVCCLPPPPRTRG